MGAQGIAVACALLLALAIAATGASAAVVLSVQHGLVRSTSGAVAFSPSTVGPSSFTQFSQFAASRPGATTSASLLSSPAASDASNADGDDILTYVVVVINTGNAAFPVTNVSVSAPLGIVATASNVTVLTGTGATASFSALSGGLFSRGISVTTALNASASDGSNVLLVLYDVVVDSSSLLPNGPQSSTATVLAGSANVSASCRLTYAAPALVVLSPSPATVSVGGSFVVSARVTFPQGLTANAAAVIRVAGLSGNAAVASLWGRATPDAGVTLGSSAVVSAATDVATGNVDVTIAIGDLTTPATTGASRLSMLLEANFTVLDIPAVAAGGHLLPSVTFSYSPSQVTVQHASASVAIVEPRVSLTSFQATPASSPVDAGVGVTCTFVLTGTTCATCGRAHAIALEIFTLATPTRVAAQSAAVSPNVAGGPSASVQSTQVLVTHLDAGGVLTVTVNAVVTSAARAGEQFTVVGRFAGFKSESTAGARAYGASQNVTSAPITVRSVTMQPAFSTSIPQTAGAALAVGESVDVTASVTLPHGTSAPVVGFRFQLNDNVTAAFVPLSITVTPGQSLTGAALAGTSQLASPPAGVNTTVAGVVVATLGTVTNAFDGARDAKDVLTVVLTVALRDIPALAANINGTVFVSFASDSTSLSATALAWTVVEPSLTLTFSSSAPPQADAYDIVSHAFTVRHASQSTSTAFQVSLSEVLPAAHVLNGSVACVGWNSALDPAGFSIATSTNSGSLIVNVTAPRISLGNALNCSFNASLGVDIQMGSLQQYAAVLLSASAPSAAGAGASWRTYSSVQQQSLSVAPPLVSVNFTGVGLPETVDPRVAIIEATNVAVVVRVPEGSASTFTVTVRGARNVNAPRISLTSAAVSLAGASLTLGGNANVPLQGWNVTVSGPQGAAFNDTATFSFGALTNWPDGKSDANDTLVLSLSLFPADDPSNSHGAPLQILADAAHGGQASSTGSASIAIAEAVLVVAGTTSVPSADALDDVDFNVTVSHAQGSDAPAFALSLAQWADVLVPALNGTVLATVASVNADSFAWVNATFLNASHSRLRTNETLIFTFRCRVVQNVLPSTSFSNRGVAQYTSAAGGAGRVTTVSGSTPFRIDDPTPSLVVVSKTMPDVASPQTVIHESMQLRAVARVPESVTPLFLEVFFPVSNGALQFVVRNATVTRVGSSLRNVTLSIGDSLANATSKGINYDTVGNLVTFPFGSVTNVADGAAGPEDEVEVLFLGHVTDIPQNARGGQLGVRTSIRYGFLSAIVVWNDTTFTIAEPDLAPVLLANVTEFDAGDPVDFTVRVPHSALSSSPAYKNTVDVVIPAHFALDAASVSAQIVTNDSTPVPVVNGQRVTVTFTRLLLGSELSLRFLATARQVVRPDELDVLSVTAVYNSTSLAVPFQGRQYSPPAVTNTLNVRTVAINATLASTSVAETLFANVSVHESFTLDVVVALPESQSLLTVTVTVTGPVPSVSPVQLSTGTVVSLGSSITGSQIATGDGFGTNPSISPQLDLSLARSGFVFAFGGITNVANNLESGADTILLRIVGYVRDVPSNALGSSFRATATANYDGNLHSSAVDFTVAETLLSTSAASSQVLPTDAGDIVSFAFGAQHAQANSTSPAFNLTAVISLESTLQFVVPSVSCAISTGVDAGSLTAVYSSVAESITLRIPRLLSDGAIACTFNATVRQSMPPSSTGHAYLSLSHTSIPPASPLFGRMYTAPAASALISSAAASATFGVRSTSLASTTGLDVTIHEHVILQVNVTLPEGLAPNVTVVVTCPLAGGVSLASVVSASVSRVGPKLNASLSTTPALVTLGNAQDRAVMRLGGVQNTASNTGTDSLSVDVDAVVQDVAANVDGAFLDFVAVVSHNNGTLIVSIPLGPLRVTVRRPVLAPAAVIAPLRVSVNSVARFNLTLAHAASSSSSAYDVRVRFFVDSMLLLNPGSLVVGGGGALVSASNVTGSAGHNTTLTVVVDASPLASPAWIYFTATVSRNVVLGTTLSASTSLNYTTVPPTPGFGGHVSFASAPFADVSVNFVYIDSSVVSSSVAGTADPSFCVGETVTLRLTGSILGGNSPMALGLSLPQSPQGTLLFTVLSATLDSVGRNINGSLLSAGAALGASPRIALSNGNRNLTFDFGTVADSPLFPLDTDDEVSATVVVALLDVAPAVSNLTDAFVASATYEGWTVYKRVAFTVVEPLLKFTVSRASSAHGDAGDVFPVVITVSHLPASMSPAYDIAVTLNLTNMALAPGFSAVVVGGSDPQPVPSVANGTSAVFTIAQLSLGSSATLTLSPLLDATAPAGASISEASSLAYFSAPSGGQPRRLRTAANATTVVVDAPAVGVAIQSTDIAATTGTDVAIGERVTFAVTVTCPEGVVLNASVALRLTGRVAGIPHLSIEAASVQSMSARVSSPRLAPGDAAPTSPNIALSATTSDAAAMDTVVFSLGDVANAFDNAGPDTIVLSVTARVLDRGGTLANVSTGANCTLTYRAGPSGALASLSSTIAVTIREPLLTLSPFSCTPTTGDAGDAVTCSASVRHAPGSTAPAFHVNFTGAIPSIFTRDLNGLTYSIDGGTPVTVSPDDALNAEAPSLPLGSVLTLRSACTLSLATPPGVWGNQTVAMSYASRPRAGMPAGAWRDYAGGSSTAKFSTLAPGNVECTTDPNWPGAQGLVVGLTSTSRLKVRLAEGRAPVKLSLSLPTATEGAGSRRAPGDVTSLLQILRVNVAFLGLQLTAIQNNPPLLIFRSRDSASAPTGPLSAAGFMPDMVDVDFGLVTNSPDNVVSDNDAIVVAIDSVVRDVPANANGRQVSFSAGADMQTASPGGASQSVISEPVLILNKSLSLPTSDVSRVRFQLSVFPAPESLAPAYVVRINDTLPPEFSLVAGSLVVTFGLGFSVLDGAASPDGLTHLDFWADALSTFASSRVIVSYEAVLSASVPTPSSTATRASLTYSALPANFTMARQYGPVVAVATYSKAFEYVRVAVDDHTGTIAGTIVGTIVGIVAGALFLAKGMSPERRAKLWPKAPQRNKVAPATLFGFLSRARTRVALAVAGVADGGKSDADGAAGAAGAGGKADRALSEGNFEGLCHVEGICAYAYIADDALRAGERLEDARFEEHQALISDGERVRTELFMRRLDHLLRDLRGNGAITDALVADLSERAYGALRKAQRAAASAAKAATETNMHRIAKEAAAKRAAAGSDESELRAVDRWAELEGREVQGRVAADEHFEVRRALDDIKTRVVGEAASKAGYSASRAEDLKGAMERDVSEAEGRMEEQMGVLVAGTHARTVRRTGLLEVRFALVDDRIGFRRARTEQAVLLARRLAAEKGLDASVATEAEEQLRREADRLEKSRALFLAKKERELAEKQTQLLQDALKGMVKRATDTVAREPTAGSFREDVRVRLEQRRALFDEMQASIEAADGADMAEWRHVWEEFEEETAKLFDGMETRAFGRLTVGGAATQEDVETALAKHRDGIAKFESVMSAQRQRQEAELRRKLAERVAKASAAAAQEQEEMAEHKDQGGRVMQRLVDAQAALGDDERERILKEHENDVTRLVRVMNLSKQRQEQTLRDKMAERRRQKLASLRRKQDDERASELRSVLVQAVSGEDIAERATELAAKQQRELEAVSEALEAEEQSELDKLQDELMRQREEALKQHEDKMAEELARMQMEHAREEIQIRQAQRVLKNLEEDLVRSFAGKDGLSDEASDRALREHQAGLERLDAAMQDERQRQQKLLQERLAAKRKRREEALQRRQTQELLREERAATAEGTRPVTAGITTNPNIVRVQAAARHEIEMAALRRQLDAETRQASEALQRKMEMERLASLEAQELRLLAELAKGGKMSQESLEALLNNAFGQRGQAENRERIRKLLLAAAK